MTFAWTGYSAPDGSFDAAGLVPGTLRVHVEGGRSLRHVETVTVAAGDLVSRDLVLDAPRQPSGR